MDERRVSQSPASFLSQREQVAQVCVDLKRRIQGEFYVIEEDEDKIVFGNTACPFAEKVLGRESMCMMTSNVFGHIAAENGGYAKVELQQTIARGIRLRDVIYLQPASAFGAATGGDASSSWERHHPRVKLSGSRFVRSRS